MDLLKEWVSTLIVISIVSTVILVLTPSGSVEKQVKTVVAIIISVIFISPFMSGDSMKIDGLTDVIDLKENSTKNYSENILLNFKNEISQKISVSIEEMGFICENIEIEAHINENNEITINKVNVHILDANEASKNKIIKHIEDLYGLKVEVSDE